jgi:hypothetical protein
VKLQVAHLSVSLPLNLLSQTSEWVALDDLLPMLNVLDIEQVTIVNAAMYASQDVSTQEYTSDESEKWH